MTFISILLFLPVLAIVVGVLKAAHDYDKNRVIEIGHFEDWGDLWKVDYTTTRGPGGADALPSDKPPSRVIRKL